MSTCNIRMQNRCSRFVKHWSFYNLFNCILKFLFCFFCSTCLKIVVISIIMAFIGLKIVWPFCLKPVWQYSASNSHQQVDTHRTAAYSLNPIETVVCEISGDQQFLILLSLFCSKNHAMFRHWKHISSHFDVCCEDYLKLLIVLILNWKIY